MKILNDLTLKNLKLNKKRTIVTIIGIILSTALICAVAGMVSSFQGTLINYAKIDGGNRHVTVENVKSDDLKYFLNNNHVESIYMVDNIGYANLEESKNDLKPYIFIKGYTKEAFENTTINLVEGRLPQDGGEVIVSESIITNGEVPLKVGDIINLNIGKRVCSDGSILNQNNPIYVSEEDEEDTCHESLTNEETKSYKIVGIMERLNYSLEPYSSPGYTIITYSDSLKTDNIDVSMLFDKDNYYKTFKENMQSSAELKDYNIDYNNDLLRWTGARLSDNTMQMLLIVATVVIGIIILTSVFVIKNSFDISIVEKTKQYGMLSSIGATSKQIKKNVLYESFILGVIGIPLGILCGILADFILVEIINLLMKDMFNIEFIFKIPLLPIILSALLGVLTIFLSVIKTAKRTSKISPIVAIRNNNEIKLTKKKLKTPKLITSLFGIGGDIAYKNLKRSKKKYRTTVISIVVSVAVFISLSTFILYGFKITGQYYTDFKYNISLYINTEDKELINKLYEEFKKTENVETSAMHRRAILNIDPKVYYSDEGFYNYFGSTKDDIEKDKNETVTLISLGEEEYNRYVKKLGLSNNVDKAILIDNYVSWNIEKEKYENINVFDIDSLKPIKGTLMNDQAFSIDVVKRTEERPMGLEGVYNSGGTLIVSDEVMNRLDSNSIVEMFFKTDDADKLEKNIKSTLNNYPELKNTNINNIDREMKAYHNMILLVSIFLYGFIIVISLIGITNIFNTITTNMNLRRKEFAMLKSIGMTKKEFNKMIRLESLMYGTKALIIGITLGLIGGYLIYKAFASGNDMHYLVPFKEIILVIVIVYVLVWLIMKYSIKKTRDQNIIETIRNDNI